MSAESHDKDQGDELEVLIEDEKGFRVTAKLNDAGENTLMLRFEGPDAPALPIAHRTGVHFLHGKTWIHMRGRVVNRRDAATAIFYQLEVKCDHVPDLQAMVFRRNAYRVKPASDAQVDVFVNLGRTAEPIHAQLMDISRTGLSIDVTQAAESALFKSTRLKIGFVLPGDPEPLALEGIVRYRQLIGARIRYGLQFDHPDSVDVADIEQRLLRYINGRQVQVIQVLKHMANS